MRIDKGLKISRNSRFLYLFPLSDQYVGKTKVQSFISKANVPDQNYCSIASNKLRNCEY